MDTDSNSCYIIRSASIKSIKLDLMPDEEIEKSCFVTVAEPSDLNNAKLGLPNTSSGCETCGSTNLRDCDGHFGVVKLPMAIYHPHLTKELVEILNQVCPGCRKIKPEKRKRLRTKSQSNIKIFPAPANNDSGCKYCSKNSSEWYPALKFKKLSEHVKGKRNFYITAEISENLPKQLQNVSLTDILPKDYWGFVSGDLKQDPLRPSKVFLSTQQVFSILSQVDSDYIKRFVPRSELLFLSRLPVIPNCHRVMELFTYADGPRLCFDDRTNAFKRVVDVSRHFYELNQQLHEEAAVGSHVTCRILDCLSMSKLYAKRSETDADPYVSKHGRKWLQEVLLSKRTDCSFRSVVVGDPKIRLGEIGIPQDVCDELYIAESVNSYNLEKLNTLCYVLLLTRELYIRRRGKLITFDIAETLEVGDAFYRPLHDGDIVLLNRPPSKHLHSLVGLSVKILPVHSVVAINPLCCGPFDGDFDGDCLHGYVAQSLLSRIELRDLVSLENQIWNVQNGESLVLLTHDSLTAAHLLSTNGVILNKFEIQQLGMLCCHQLPFPAIVKSMELYNLWSGQQLLMALLSPCLDYLSKYSIEQSCKVDFPADSSPGIKKYLSQVLKCSGKLAVDVLFSLQDVLCEWLSIRGLTVSLSDIYLTPDRYSRMKLMDEVSYALQEAEYACLMKELIANPEVEFLLQSHEKDEYPNVSADIQRKKFKNISQISVAAFKDVYRDLQRAVYEHIGKENSMLAMINSGSKGSIAKLVQQSVCLGLQLSDLSYFNADPCSMAPNDGDCEGQSYDVIRASFIDGLDPIECFVHSVSSRPSMFKENNQIPGTLTRKLMFYLRDMYLAYDGTVRNSYGQQIVQFSYDQSGEIFDKNCEPCELLDSGFTTIEGGQPVGALAASSISEAAYGALEHIPSTSIEASPLRSLKKIFEGGRSSRCDRTVSLVLIKKLSRWTYGHEYGALEVKNHLDRVIFSDLVDNYMISYAGFDCQRKGFSPWILHFHVDKERIMRKRLNVEAVVRKLGSHYNSRTEKLAIPKLHMRNQCCQFINDEEHEQVCLTVEVELSQYTVSFETIRDCIIPILLETLLKGFLELKKVEILWDTPLHSHKNSDGELILRVTMSEACPPGKFWSIITDACIPVMDLIDWKRSHPNNITENFHAHGITVAWEYFLRDLRSTAYDIGRKIRKEHLLLVADSMTMTGEFFGLTARGLEMQRKSATISSPFNQACFSMPRDCFINAAKQGFEDPLSGNLDALIWGKQASVGTGGPFKLIYSGKVHKPKDSESIYETLRHIQSVGPQKNHVQSRAPSCKALDMKWRNVGEMNNSLRTILNKYEMDELLNEEDKSLLMEALKYHPRGGEKVGVGIQDIKIGRDRLHRSRCFILVRTDGSTDDFSYKKCVDGFRYKVSKNFTVYEEVEAKEGLGEFKEHRKVHNVNLYLSSLYKKN